MHIANQASATISSKYGHFWLQKNKMATGKMQTQGFKTAVHKPMGDVKDDTSIYNIFTWITSTFLLL